MFFFAFWKVLCQLAPWLLLGMVFSGLLHVLLPAGFVRRKFRGFTGVVKSVLLGVPLPLCSCGVVPAGIGLKNQGASNGAAVGFLISTPQTGVDSILVSASFFGWPFAFFKMFAAAITGLAGGWLTDLAEPDTALEGPATSALPVVDQAMPATNSENWWRELIAHSIEIVRSIWLWLLIGIVISAGIETYWPTSWYQTIGKWGVWPSMLLVLVVATPLYVCATASVPIAAALVTGGLPPAAAMVFLMAGPATNVTTIGAIYGRFGWKTLCIYLATITIGSMIFAWLFDWLLTATVTTGDAHDHNHNHWLSIVSGAVLAGMMIVFAIADLIRWWNRRRLLGRQFDADEVMHLRIGGMTCGGCVSKLESALGKSAGVESVSVELSSGIATIVGHPQRQAIVDRVAQLGFQVVDD